MFSGESYLKDIENYFKPLVAKFNEELSAIRGSRPSPELIQDIMVNHYNEDLPIKHLGSLSVMPPRTIQINVWDKNAVGAVVKAIEGAKRGFSVSNDGNNVFATISPLMSERRDELTKLVKKTSENFRIQVRAKRDDALKALKDAESKKEATEDQVFKLKEKVQKLVDGANSQIESAVNGKIKELEG